MAGGHGTVRALVIALVAVCVGWRGCSGFAVQLSVYDASLKATAASLFRDPSVSCSSRCQGHEVSHAC